MARRPLDPELQELIPLFIDEVRDRLERLATLVPRLPEDEDARTQVKRELHTVKGAARMLQLGEIAELCHASEELVDAGPGRAGGLLTRVVDRLSAMIDTVASGVQPESDPELLQLVIAAHEEPEAGAEPKAGPKADAEVTLESRDQVQGQAQAQGQAQSPKPKRQSASKAKAKAKPKEGRRRSRRPSPQRRRRRRVRTR